MGDPEYLALVGPKVVSMDVDQSRRDWPTRSWLWRVTGTVLLIVAAITLLAGS